MYCLRAMDLHTLIPLSSIMLCLVQEADTHKTSKHPILFVRVVGLSHPKQGLKVSIKGPMFYRNQGNFRLLRKVRVEGT